MIIDSNQVCYAKMLDCRVQEGVLTFSNPADQKNHVEAFTSYLSFVL
jgi:hypothetical protein